MIGFFWHRLNSAVDRDFLGRFSQLGECSSLKIRNDRSVIADLLRVGEIFDPAEDAIKRSSELFRREDEVDLLDSCV